MLLRELIRTLSLIVAIGVTAIAVATASDGIQVSDDLGNEFELQQPAQRIISLAPNITELLFFVGAGEQIVGADEFSDYPEAARAIPRVNNYAAANYELILALKPDLVIAWRSGNGREIIERLQQLGLRVFVLEPRRMHDIPNIILRLGMLTGHGASARQQSNEFVARVQKLQQQFSNREPVSVFYQIWNDPLITLNGEHLVSDVINLCGGKNIFADAAPLVPYVSMESVVAASPDVIVASGSSEAAPTWLGMWDKWSMIPAVRDDRVHFIPPDLMQRHSMRIIEGATRLCEMLERAR